MIFRFFILILFINNVSFSQNSEEKKTDTSSYISNSKNALKAEISVNIAEGVLVAENMNTPIIVSVKNIGDNFWPEGEYTIEVKTFKTPTYVSPFDETLFDFQKTIELSNLAPNSQVEIQSYPYNSPSIKGIYTLKISILKDHHNFNAINSEITIAVTVID